MAVNIFEELVKTYLQTQGYFVMENVCYGPPATEKEITSPSDIDIIAIAPRKRKKPILAISCKGYTEPFEADKIAMAVLNGGNYHSTPARKAFRELADDNWASLFCKKVRDLTSSEKFQHVTAVTSYTGNYAAWKQNPTFIERMGGTPLDLWDLKKVLKGIDQSNALPHNGSTQTQLWRLIKSLEEKSSSQTPSKK